MLKKVYWFSNAPSFKAYKPRTRNDPFVRDTLSCLQLLLRLPIPHASLVANVAVYLLQHRSDTVFVNAVRTKNLIVDIVMRHLPSLEPGVCNLSCDFSRSVPNLRHLKAAQNVRCGSILGLRRLRFERGRWLVRGWRLVVGGCLLGDDFGAGRVG